MAVTTTCPGCGAELTFQTGAPLRVCDHCHSVIARRDRDLENLGKVVDLVETQSPLELWLDGRYQGKKFTLVGRAQLAHPKGGAWEEWYASFEDGRWGWLAEHQGRFVLTFEVSVGTPPRHEDIQPGRLVPQLPGGPWTVVEETDAKRMGAAGELPYRLTPGEVFRFADLSGPDKQFATIDWGPGGQGPPAFYAGREVTLAELGWDKLAPAARDMKSAQAAQVKSERLACPECDGALELRAPDQTQRVGCPYCGALLDVGEHHTLSKLRMLDRRDGTPAIELGKTGTLRGVAWTVIGFFVRATGPWEWEEYLLYQPAQGFRWLVRSNGHWSFVTPVPAGEVDTVQLSPRHGGRRYRHFQGGRAEVKLVLGECYWKVEPGEAVNAEDYVAPPYMLSKEEDDQEVNWSLGEWLPPAEVAKAFGVPDVPGIGVAPHQPYPHRNVLKAWGLLIAAVFALFIGVGATRGDTRVFREFVVFEPPAPGATTSVVFTDPMPLRGKRNVQVSLRYPVSNDWLYVEGDFVDEDTGVVQEWSTTVEYYYGVDDGEAWSEGSQTKRVYLSAPPGGLYVLRLEAQRKSWSGPAQVEIEVRQGVPRWKHLLFLLLGISLIPLGVVIHLIAFEKQRWSESDHAGGDDE